LSALHLCDAPITNQGLAHLAALLRLVVLEPGGTRVTDAGLARLRAELPSLEIETAPEPKDP
jgi:hypothetical protein